MAESDELRKLELEWLRLTADCMQLAGELHNPLLQRHFLRMAHKWSAQLEQSQSSAIQTEALD